MNNKNILNHIEIRLNILKHQLKRLPEDMEFLGKEKLWLNGNTIKALIWELKFVKRIILER